MKIDGVPTVKAFSPKSVGPIDYAGERKAGPLKSFALANQPSFVTSVTGANYKEFQASNPEQRKAILLTTKPGQSSLLKAISSEFHGRVSIGQGKSSDKKLLEQLGVEPNSDFPLLLALRRDADKLESQKWLDKYFPGDATFARLSLADAKKKPTFRMLEFFLMSYARAPSKAKKNQETGAKAEL